MLRKASNFHSLGKGFHKKVAPEQIEIPVCRGIDGHRGSGLGALEEIFG